LALLVRVMARRHEVVMSCGRNCDMKRFPGIGLGRKGRIRTGKSAAALEKKSALETRIAENMMRLVGRHNAHSSFPFAKQVHFMRRLEVAGCGFEKPEVPELDRRASC